MEPDYEIIEDDEECEDGEWVDADDLGVTYPFEAIKVSPVSNLIINCSGICEIMF